MKISAINHSSVNFKSLLKQATAPMISEQKILATKNSCDKFVKSSKGKGKRNSGACSGCSSGCMGACYGCSGGCMGGCN